ncbi:hypothetical protein Back11_08160 [Paenibacillus baekrokdamisoli]|uniref:Uncharacterized protein n=1 Tax=Paenibacillus baekrokdamisoli TaxID=1712516 RepID=A0A3G9J0S2_9BACL|nr:hypothetical protein [Paenibacillus baekrokdamisoli]MBB3067343.1 hypothetical protein [Paenibacillus baekrokdamisoli]BBH19471.1 hypothetical protein Back11_08160 [Paenibacillus baekrokdamisoli]
MRSPTVGDVYCIYSPLLKKYTACQITKWEPPVSKRSKGDAAILGLDWAGEEPLTPYGLQELRPLILDHHHWNKCYDELKIDAYIPKHYIYVGTITPLSTEAPRGYSYGGWREGEQFINKIRWESIPLTLRETFKKASKEHAQIQIGEKFLTKYSSTADEELLRSLSDLSELAQFPCLTEIRTDRLTDSLLTYITGNPLINKLELRGNGLESVDLSGTNLLRLYINAEGIEELVLNKGLMELTLAGSVSPSLRIHIENDGESLEVTFFDQVPDFQGLDRLGALSLTNVTEIDLAKIVKQFSSLRILKLWGKPGYISNLKCLEQVSTLQRLFLFNLFGFTGDQFPEPDKLPDLTWLSLSSIPAEAGKAIKKTYKNEPASRMFIDITQLRKPEWLLENLENPFRDWEVREQISLANAKKAREQYKKTRGAIQGLREREATGQEVDMESVLESIVVEYTQAFNKMNRRTHFIETLECEEVFVALEELLQTFTDSEKLTRKMLEVFEQARDF